MRTHLMEKFVCNYHIDVAVEVLRITSSTKEGVQKERNRRMRIRSWEKATNGLGRRKAEPDSGEPG